MNNNKNHRKNKTHRPPLFLHRKTIKNALLSITGGNIRTYCGLSDTKRLDSVLSYTKDFHSYKTKKELFTMISRKTDAVQDVERRLNLPQGTLVPAIRGHFENRMTARAVKIDAEIVAEWWDNRK